ncbi:hypothetical protein L7F22_050817 [Adiantum nelumboides]|nr:hypothetical protein [Adiantum nelumboides]
MQHCAEHFRNLFNLESDNSAEREEAVKLMLSVVDPCTEECNAKRLEQQFDEEELFYGLKKLGNDKTPGICGISKECMIEYWPELKMLVTAVINQAWLSQCMDPKLKQGLIKLLPKKIFLSAISDRRPITPMGIMYKIMAKAIAMRISPFLRKHIHPLQTGFIGRRSIMDNILIVQMGIEAAQKSGQETILLQLDFAKAFDTIIWDFVVKQSDFVDAKQGIISSKIDINEKTGLSEKLHARHASIAAQSDQETCLSKPVCDLECSLGVEHEENANAALHTKAIILDDIIQEGFMSMVSFQDIGDDVDALDNIDPYVFDVNIDSEGVQDDDQSIIATGARVCYDDVMEKEIDAIFVKHAESCDIEVKRYLSGSVKLSKHFMTMHETCNDVSYDHDIEKQDCSSSKEEDMELMDLLDDALEGF